jgi:hypothetical protein
LCATCLACLFSSPQDLNSAKFKPQTNRLPDPTKHGLFPIGKFIKGENHMFNSCVLIGVVCGDVDLARDRDGHIRITFQLAIQFLDKPVGRIEVLSSGHLTFLAAKYLRLGDRVAVMGFLSMREWHNDATLTAMDLELIKGGDHNQG